MTIRLECDTCGESLTLRDNAAGRKLKCRCGAAIQVPERCHEVDDTDDVFERRPISQRPRKPRRRRSDSASLVKYGILAGGSLIGLVALFFLYQTIFVAKSWKSDTQLLGELEQEQAGAGFAIRPPVGWRKIEEKIQDHNGADGIVSIHVADWKGANGKLHLEVWQNPAMRRRRHPLIENNTTGDLGVYIDRGAEPMYVLPGAKIAKGQLGGRLFTRVAFQLNGMSIGPVAHDFPNHLIYITYIDDQRVDIVASSHAALDSHEFKILEESLKSLRKLAPGETLNAPGTNSAPVVVPNSPQSNAVAPQSAAQAGARDQSNGLSPIHGGPAGNAKSEESAQKPAAVFQSDDSPVLAPPGTASAPAAFTQKTSKTDWSTDSGSNGVISFQSDEFGPVMADLNPNLVVVHDKLFDVTKGTTIGTFPVVKEKMHQKAAVLSPDGKYVAIVTKMLVDSPQIATIYTVGTDGPGQPLSTNEKGKASNWVQFASFSGPDRLVIGVRSHQAPMTQKICIFDVEKRILLKEISCDELGEIGVVSSDGKYLCNHARSGMPVYDLTRGAKVATMERPRGMEGSVIPYGRCCGLAFSPDGAELAALLNHNRVVVWSAKGKIVFDETLMRDVTDSSLPRADGLQWLPDGKSWILGQHHLLHREQKLLLWELRRKWPYDRLPVRVFDQDFVLVPVLDRLGGDLVKQKIPWHDMNRATAALNLDDVAAVKPGGAMSISVQVFNVRFGDPQAVANMLGTALTKRIELSGFKVQKDQDTVLLATYNEEQGDAKKVLAGNGLGRDTGLQVNDSKGKLIVKVVSKDRDETIWEQSIKCDGGLFIEGEINDVSVRNRMFKFMEARVNQLALPTLFIKPGKLQLPVITSLER